MGFMGTPCTTHHIIIKMIRCTIYYTLNEFADGTMHRTYYNLLRCTIHRSRPGAHSAHGAHKKFFSLRSTFFNLEMREGRSCI